MALLYLNITLGVVIVVLNLVEISIIVRRRKRIKPYEQLLSSLAMADTLTGLFLFCIKVYVIAQKNEEAQKNATNILYCIALTTVLISTASLGSITGDRLLAIKYPFYHRAVVTKSRVWFCAIMEWVITWVLVTIPILIGTLSSILPQDMISVYHKITAWLLIISGVAFCVCYAELLWCLANRPDFNRMRDRVSTDTKTSSLQQKMKQDDKMDAEDMDEGQMDKEAGEEPGNENEAENEVEQGNKSENENMVGCEKEADNENEAEKEDEGETWNGKEDKLLLHNATDSCNKEEKKVEERAGVEPGGKHGIKVISVCTTRDKSNSTANQSYSECDSSSISSNMRIPTSNIQVQSQKIQVIAQVEKGDSTGVGRSVGQDSKGFATADNTSLRSKRSKVESAEKSNKIGHRIHANRREELKKLSKNERRVNRKVVLTCVTIVFIYIVCTTPYTVQIMLGGDPLSGFTGFMLFLNSLLNPLVYFYKDYLENKSRERGKRVKTQKQKLHKTLRRSTLEHLKS